MTAITYFGEMLVASLLAIVLLAISPLETRYAGALFAGGAVAWTFSEYVVRSSLRATQLSTNTRCIMPILTSRCLQFSGIWALGQRRQKASEIVVMAASASVHDREPFPDLEPAHCRLIGERLQQDLKPDAGPMPARLEWLLRLEDAA